MMMQGFREGECSNAFRHCGLLRNAMQLQEWQYCAFSLLVLHEASFLLREALQLLPQKILTRRHDGHIAGRILIAGR